MTILITGGTGFVGAATVDHCARAGEEVVVLAAHAPEPGWLPAGVEVRLADIRDAQALAAVMRERRPRAVIHGAAITAGPRWSAPIPSASSRSMSAAPPRCCRRPPKPAARVVICSSASVYPLAKADTERFRVDRDPPAPARSTASPRRWPRRSRRGLARSMG